MKPMTEQVKRLIGKEEVGQSWEEKPSPRNSNIRFEKYGKINMIMSVDILNSKMYGKFSIAVSCLNQADNKSIAVNTDDLASVKALRQFMYDLKRLDSTLDNSTLRRIVQVINSYTLNDHSLIRMKNKSAEGFVTPKRCHSTEFAIQKNCPISGGLVIEPAPEKISLETINPLLNLYCNKGMAIMQSFPLNDDIPTVVARGGNKLL